ncbi:MAG TPA: hypothetical protein VMM37_02955 [Bacteroidota bacterium]|nr:hypothetical protein [Bacteroidota bacterium]
MNNKQSLKLVLVLGILTLTVASVLSAQGMGGMQRMRMSPEQQATVLKDSLGLDSTQTAKVTTIYKEQQDEMAKIRDANQGDFDAMRTAMTEMRTKTDNKIKEVLTDAQKTKYEEMMKNRPMGRMGRGRGN